MYVGSMEHNSASRGPSSGSDVEVDQIRENGASSRTTNDVLPQVSETSPPHASSTPLTLSFPGSTQWEQSQEGELSTTSSSIHDRSSSHAQDEHDAAPIDTPPQHQDTIVDHSNGSQIKVHHESLPKWPYKTLEHTSKSFLVNAFADTLLLIPPLGFIAIAIMGEILHEKLVVSNKWGLHLIDLKKYGVTIYLILFAATCGPGLKNIAAWRLTHGARVEFLEQMLGSSSVISTLTTQYKLRAFGPVASPVAAALVAIWALSPVGSQAVLRFLETGSRSSSSHVSVYYINSNSSGLSSVFLAPQNPSPDSITRVYQASLLAPNSTHNGPRDPWGNVKIPQMEKFRPNSSAPAEWVAVPDNSTYSSLVGVAIANLSESGDSAFLLPSSYFNLYCPDGPKVLPWWQEILWMDESGDGQYRGTGQSVDGFGSPRFSSPYSNISIPFNFWSIGTFGTTIGSRPRPPMSPMNIYFQFSTIDTSKFEEEIIALKCRLTYSNVESQVLCSGKNCRVVSMRSRNSHPADVYASPLDSGARDFFDTFSQSTGTNRLLTEFVKNNFLIQYLQHGYNPIGTPDYTKQANLSAISGELLAERLSRLMNSLWQPSLSLEFVTGNFPGNISTMPGIETTTATLLLKEEIFVCSHVWFALLLVSSLVLFTVGVTGYSLKYFVTVAPSIIGHVSSFTRDNPHVRIPQGGSSLSGFKRARLIKDVVIKIGDSKPNSTVGHIVIMSPEDGGDSKARLSKERKYE